MDVWQYILKENLAIPSIYFTHKRNLFMHENMLLSVSDVVRPDANDEVKEMQVRYRTVGDMTCTGAVISNASNIAEIIQEVASARVTERGGRADDKRSEAAMEDRKREGYF